MRYKHRFEFDEGETWPKLRLKLGFLVLFYGVFKGRFWFLSILKIPSVSQFTPHHFPTQASKLKLKDVCLAEYLMGIEKPGLESGAGLTKLNRVVRVYQ